jgi:pentatricopeptide repeat protein
MDGLGRAGRIEQMLQIFIELVKKGFQPEPPTFLAVLNGFALQVRSSYGRLHREIVFGDQ